MEILSYLIIPIILIYTILIVIFSWQWIKMSFFDCANDEANYSFTKFSILIPFRNEEKNLPLLFQDLEAQHYPTSQFEVIFIDDESSDDSLQIIQNLIKSSKLSCTTVISLGGKKKAIQKGLNQAAGDFIISLDADVRIGPKLIQCYHNYYQSSKAKLIAGPVRFANDRGILSKLFSLEFSSLIASAAAAISLQKPMMLNAANMGFERAVALGFEKEIYQSEQASGDDQFLMEAIERKYGAEQIHFLKSNEAIASTLAPENLSQFFNQRVRWASKTSSYTSRFSQVVAVLIFLFNTIVLGSLILSIIQQCAFPFLLMYSIKLLIDLPILLSISFFFRQQKNMLYYPLLQFLYPWYIVIVAVWSLIGGYSWKGRKY